MDPGTCCFVMATRDHPLLLVDAYDGSVRASYTAIADGDVTTAPHSTTFSPSGTHIYGGMDGKIAIFDISIQGANPISYLSTTPTRKSNQGQKGILSHLSTSPIHPSLVLAGSYSKSFAIYDTTCNESVALINGIPGTGVTQVEFGVDGNSIHVASRKSGTIQTFDARKLGSGVAVLEMERDGFTNQRISFSQSADGRVLVSGDRMGNVCVFDLMDGGKLLTKTSVSGETVGAAAVHPYYCPSSTPIVGSEGMEVDGESTKMSYWIGSCSGQRREIRVRGNYCSSDSDSDSEEEDIERKDTGVSAEINMYHFVH
ncbi:UNVERIFIED_CONTAM: hypothetical protein HDU68_005067 [Siphonaria sp. JEL0065]|nr:hypothetical protein HDU68_005067 [Siphonaria sp. JEL0065]